MSPAAKSPPCPSRAVLARTYATSEMAQALARALAPDNAGFVRCRVEGRKLTLEAEASSVGELQRSLDDALACLSAAERTWKSAQGLPTEEPAAARIGDEEEDDGS